MSHLYHIQINVKDSRISFPFYKEFFKYLQYEITSEGEDHIGFSDKVNDIWIVTTEADHKNTPFNRKNTGLNHIAFILNSKEKVDQFTKEFLKTKNIPTLYDSPKLFPEYSNDYYAVYFEDPDRIKLEVVYRSSRNKSDKDYLGWHKKKINIDEKEIVPDFHQRDIWWCSLGLNIGYEEDGKNDEFERPVLVLKKFSKDVFIGLPITSTKKDSPYYFPYTLHNQEGSIILSHPRLLSSKRLNRRLLKIGRGIFKQITEKYLLLFS